MLVQNTVAITPKLIKRLLTVMAVCMMMTASAQQKLDLQAHRGGRGLMPENTIPAMLDALQRGVRTLELDCVISQDGQVVVSHDVYMSADFMRKPDGIDISKSEEKQLLLYKMPYDSIRRFDAGTKPHAKFPEQKKIKTYRPLLSALMDSVELYAKAHHLKPVFYNLEIKSTPQEDDVAHPRPDVFVKLVMDVLKEKKITSRVTIQSFDVRPLQVLHKVYPKQTLSYLITNPDNFEAVMQKLGFTPQIISPYYVNLTADFVNQAHQSKMQVIPWTVNDEDAMKKMAEIKVDGIISDYPDKLIALFGRYN